MYIVSTYLSTSDTEPTDEHKFLENLHMDIIGITISYYSFKKRARQNGEVFTRRYRETKIQH